MKFPYRNRGQSRNPICVCLAMLSLALFPKNNALCRTPSSPSESDAKQMVTKFRTALEKHDTLQADQIRRELQILDKTALPAIRDALPDCSEAEKRQFIGILTGIAGDETTQFLLQLACQSPDTNVVSAALNAIGNRPINFALTTNQFEWLVTKLLRDTSSMQLLLPAFSLGANEIIRVGR